MREVLTIGQNILQELGTCFRKLSASQIDHLIEEIKKSERVFCVGAGRSRIFLEAFCMRLNHLGKEAYVAGHIPCPPVRKGDLVITASGSGTPSVVAILKRVKEAGGRVVLLTASPVQNMEDIVDLRVNIDAPNGLVNKGDRESRQLMRTLFEQTCFILEETLIAVLSTGISPEEIAARHTNLE
jgi:6-phospho-3-hexuloisomerase